MQRETIHRTQKMDYSRLIAEIEKQKPRNASRKGDFGWYEAG
jgi:hypothetical protein